MARQLTQLTASASQQLNAVGDSGIVVGLLLFFLPTQNGWGFNVTYNDFVFNGGFLTNSPNLLRNFRNIIPFGLMCTTTDGYEPEFIEDFIDGRVSLYLLNAAEVIQIEAEFYA